MQYYRSKAGDQMGCPYHTLPQSSYWDFSVGRRAADAIDPHLASDLTITRQARVGSAGSCFAQNISQALVERGYNYFVTETAPSFMSAEDARRFGYGVFSARYGNV